MFQVILSKYIDIPKLCSKNVIFYKNTYNEVMDYAQYNLESSRVLSKNCIKCISTVIVNLHYTNTHTYIYMYVYVCVCVYDYTKVICVYTR